MPTQVREAPTQILALPKLYRAEQKPMVYTVVPP